jgi:hypothetical protein
LTCDRQTMPVAVPCGIGLLDMKKREPNYQAGILIGLSLGDKFPPLYSVIFGLSPGKGIKHSAK